jgi:hypothetical protein
LYDDLYDEGDIESEGVEGERSASKISFLSFGDLSDVFLDGLLEGLDEGDASERVEPIDVTEHVAVVAAADAEPVVDADHVVAPELAHVELGGAVPAPWRFQLLLLPHLRLQVLLAARLCQ